MSQKHAIYNILKEEYFCVRKVYLQKKLFSDIRLALHVMVYKFDIESQTNKFLYGACHNYNVYTGLALNFCPNNAPNVAFLCDTPGRQCHL